MCKLLYKEKTVKLLSLKRNIFLGQFYYNAGQNFEIFQKIKPIIYHDITGNEIVNQ